MYHTPKKNPKAKLIKEVQQTQYYEAAVVFIFMENVKKNNILLDQ